VILFGINYSDRSQLRALNARIQRVVRRGSGARIGALISVDQEGGVVKRFKDMPPWRSAPELGRLDDTDVTRGEARATGRALGGVGVNIDLAPVADLDIGPKHVMRNRAFGSRRGHVAWHVVAFTRGLQDKGVAAAVKHFPGLGGADRNSDAGPAYVRRTRRQLRKVDVVPFQRAINNGARVIMMSHAIYPKDGGRKPASINRFIASTRLRDHMGFRGVSMSDAVDAIKWWFDGDIGKTCVATIGAGVDVALLADNVFAARTCANAIVKAVRSGRLSKKRVERSARRIVELKRWLGVYGS
jgi:beta-N-acetylhexosaminidase